MNANDQKGLFDDGQSGTDGFADKVLGDLNASGIDCSGAVDFITHLCGGDEKGSAMDNNHVWKLDQQTREIIDAVALEYKGYAIKKYLFKKEKMSVCMESDDEHPWADFKLNPDRYFLRSQLFGYQRYFGKWGGERVPEYDRDYSHWYFTYLQCYRAKLPSLFELKDDGPWVKFAVKREEAAADLRKNFALLGKDDLKELSIADLEEAMRGDFTLSCERGLEPYIQNRAMVMLANACNHELVLRLMDPEHLDETGNAEGDVSFEKVDFKRIREAFSQYVNRGIVDEDDNINRVIYKMLQWFLTTHPGHASYTNRSYILYGLMYLHLYRTEFSCFGGIQDRVKKWRKESFDLKEHWASQFRKHLSILREASAMMDQLGVNKHETA